MSNENVCRFEKLLQGVKREGVEELLNFIRGSDFYTAPASTRYHLAEEGGFDVIFADACMQRMTPGFAGTFVDVPHFAVSGRLKR